MSGSMPKVARSVLDDGVLCYLAASTTNGPHLTPVVYAVDRGRLWVTTARSSAKAKAWAKDPTVAGLVRNGDRAVVFRGTVTTYDAFDPLTWPSAVVAAPRLVTAATRFTLRNARFFFGYAADAPNVPLAWAPPARVFVAITITGGRALDLASGTVVSRWGGWPAVKPRRGRRALAPAERARALDLRVPKEIRHVIGEGGAGAVALQDRHGPDGPVRLTVLPSGWRRLGSFDAYEAILPAAFLALADDPMAAPSREREGMRDAAITMDRAAAWRAAEMTGMLVQGAAETGSGERGAEALLRVRPRRIVWWEGWTSGSVARRAARTEDPAIAAARTSAGRSRSGRSRAPAKGST